MIDQYEKENKIDTYDVLEDLHRAMADMRRGSPIVISAAKRSILVCAAETADSVFSDLTRFLSLKNLSLAMTGRRASTLGLSIPEVPAVVIRHEGIIEMDMVIELINPAADKACPDLVKKVTAVPRPAASVEHAAVCLAKIARLLPAVIFGEIGLDNGKLWAEQNRRAQITAESVFQFETTAADTLEAISEAEIPLKDCGHVKLIAFRSRSGGSEHIAVVVGDINTSEPVLTRLHSECFTGDLLNSLKCDCGDQLRGAIKLMTEKKSGVLLYLGQEGRGIGLINKLRAYQLQESGFDTIDANEQLGFEDDERIYSPAAEILKKLSVKRVILLTNNPSKVSALSRHGIVITDRESHIFPTNKHNLSYVKTKAERSGHIIKES